MEADLISELIARDTPYYDPTISHETFASLSRFAMDMGLLSKEVPYEAVIHPPPPQRGRAG